MERFSGKREIAWYHPVHWKDFVSLGVLLRGNVSCVESIEIRTDDMPHSPVRAERWGSSPTERRYAARLFLLTQSAVHVSIGLNWLAFVSLVLLFRLFGMLESPTAWLCNGSAPRSDVLLFVDDRGTPVRAPLAGLLALTLAPQRQSL